VEPTVSPRVSRIDREFALLDRRALSSRSARQLIDVEPRVSLLDVLREHLSRSAGSDVKADQTSGLLAFLPQTVDRNPGGRWRDSRDLCCKRSPRPPAPSTHQVRGKGAER
jgi:hypothetical protein